MWNEVKLNGIFLPKILYRKSELCRSLASHLANVSGYYIYRTWTSGIFVYLIMFDRKTFLSCSSLSCRSRKKQALTEEESVFENFLHVYSNQRFVNIATLLLESHIVCGMGIWTPNMVFIWRIRWRW